MNHPMTSTQRACNYSLPAIGDRLPELWPPEIATRALIAETVRLSRLTLTQIDRLTPSKDQYFASGNGWSTSRLQRYARGEAVLSERAICYFDGKQVTLLDALDHLAPGCKARFKHVVWRVLDPRRQLSLAQLARLAEGLESESGNFLASACRAAQGRPEVAVQYFHEILAGDGIGHDDFALLLISFRALLDVMPRLCDNEIQYRLLKAAQAFSCQLALPVDDGAAVIVCASEFRHPYAVLNERHGGTRVRSLWKVKSDQGLAKAN